MLLRTTREWSLVVRELKKGIGGATHATILRPYLGGR